MRYLFYILLIIFIVTAFAYKYGPKTSPPQRDDTAIIINDRYITKEEFQRLYKSGSPHLRDKREFINSLIEKELLIQEARKMKIDQEEPFRASIQNFYEQSLIKILMDRKFSSPEIVVDDKEVNRYISMIGKRLHLTILSYRTERDANSATNAVGKEESVAPFRDLSRPVRTRIYQLRKGERTTPFRNGKYFQVIVVEGIEDLPPTKSALPSRQEIRELLLEEKREEYINNWLSRLKKNAAIEVMITE